MRAARSVAGLALQSAVAEWSARIVGTRVLGAEDACDARIVVTTQTGVGSLWAVGRGVGRRGVGRGCVGGARGIRHRHGRERHGKREDYWARAGNESVPRRGANAGSRWWGDGAHWAPCDHGDRKSTRLN